MTTAFEHVHATTQAVNLQCIAHGHDGFILEIATAKAGYVSVQVLKGGGFNRRHEDDDPKAEGATLEDACGKLLMTERWERWIVARQKQRTDVIKDEEKSRLKSLAKHDSRLSALRELPTFTVTADGTAPDDPKAEHETTRYDVIASDTEEVSS